MEIYVDSYVVSRSQTSTKTSMYSKKMGQEWVDDINDFFDTGYYIRKVVD